MHALLLVALAVHVFAGAFWFGASGVAARLGAGELPGLTRAQLGAGGLAILAGTVVTAIVRLPVGSTSGLLVAVGVGCALAAWVVQALFARRMARGVVGGLAAARRSASALLALTVIAMSVAPFA
jgi:hypothetical protein